MHLSARESTTCGVGKTPDSEERENAVSYEGLQGADRDQTVSEIAEDSSLVLKREQDSV